MLFLGVTAIFFMSQEYLINKLEVDFYVIKWIKYIYYIKRGLIKFYSQYTDK